MPKILITNSTSKLDNRKAEESPLPFQVVKEDAQSFPEQLFMILQDKGNEKSIKWSHDGIKFLVIDRKKLCLEILPRYFSHSAGFRYNSFVRRLRRWNFKRSSSGMNTRIFSHPLFQRDKPLLCKQMTCTLDHKRTPRLGSTPSRNCSSRKGENGSKLSSMGEGSFIFPSFFNGCKINRMGKYSVLAKLRHDASILYDYHKTPFPCQVLPEMFLSEASSSAKTQAVIDAAVNAMKRCDEIVSENELNMKTQIIIDQAVHAMKPSNHTISAKEELASLLNKRAVLSKGLLVQSDYLNTLFRAPSGNGNKCTLRIP